MQVLNRPWGAMHYRVDGPADGPTVVFANSLGTDLRLWDGLLAKMPGLRAIRFDKRGHGLSDEGGAFSIDDLADDAAALIEHLGAGPVVFVGLSIGGMIAQSLAARRPDLLRAVVLSNTAVKMGTAESWADRIAAVRGPGYAAACEALAATDLAAGTAGLRLPVLVIAGDQDGSSPAELVKATADLIPGAAFHVIPDAGHLPCVEQPAAYAAILAPFVQEHAR